MTIVIPEGETMMNYHKRVLTVALAVTALAIPATYAATGSGFENAGRALLDTGTNVIITDQGMDDTGFIFANAPTRDGVGPVYATFKLESIDAVQHGLPKIDDRQLSATFGEIDELLDRIETRGQAFESHGQRTENGGDGSERLRVRKRCHQ